MKASSVTLAVVAGIVLTGCQESAPEPPAAAPAKAAADRNACHLLTHEEVSTLTERPIALADQTEAGDDFSTCQWETDTGLFALGLTVYWSGGKQQWETWRTAQGLGDAILKESTGVSGSEAVEQGVVAGLGDAAYFSGVLPSLVLKGDTLFEVNLALVPRADAKFVDLGRKLLAKAP